MPKISGTCSFNKEKDFGCGVPGLGVTVSRLGLRLVGRWWV